ncbi:MAG: hypothetical protein ABSF15_17070 [Candidatus Sulfotelmatobacter sp.]|jgi:hypothetical protein
MPTTVKSESPRTHSGESSFVSLLSGWAQQGVQSFFATQRILLDLAMRQNASLMHSLRQQLSDPHHSPTAILTEVTAEGIANFIEGQKILLELGHQQNELLMTGMKERVGAWPAAEAVTDLMRRSLETFIDMQQEILKTASRQTHTWVEAAKNGKPYQVNHLVEMAQEAMETFVKAQKQFMDVIADEAAKATGGRHAGGTQRAKKTELSQLARKATESFIDAQKKLVDVAGRQMNAGVKTAGKTLELFRPFPFLPLAELTREGVKSYVDAQKELMEVMVKPGGERKSAHRVETRVKRSSRKAAVAHA